MSFKYCPSFISADHVLIGRNVDGSWSGHDADGAFVTFSDEAVEQSFCLTAGADGTGLYAVPDALRNEPRRFRSDAAAGVAYIEGGDRPVDYPAFARHALRVDGDGAIICSMMQPLHEQYTRCEGRSAGQLHRTDIGLWADAARESEMVAHQVDAGLHDIVVSGIEDGLSFMDMWSRINSAAKLKPVHEQFDLATSIPGSWSEIREFPQYMITPIRSLFGHYMEEMLGEFPIERVSRLHAPRGFPLAAHIEGIADMLSEDAPFEGGNIIPGYRTSPVAHFRGDGFDAIVFSDMAGTYAYAWPTQEHQLEPKGPGI